MHSLGVQAPGPILDPRTAAIAGEDNTMSRDHMNREMLGPDGQILVYAPPILIGFIGSPLALADSLPRRRPKGLSKKNWAKRRAYEG